MQLTIIGVQEGIKCLRCFTILLVHWPDTTLFFSGVHVKRRVDIALYLLLRFKQNYFPSEALTLKAPITTAADDIYKYYFIVFQIK